MGILAGAMADIGKQPSMRMPDLQFFLSKTVD